MVKIIGASVTSFGPRPDQSITSMAIEAGLSAMRDANADYADVGAGFFSNALAPSSSVT